jgi:hypothetical protein
MTSTKDHTALKEAAESATGGEWSVFTKGKRATDLVDVGPDQLISCACTGKPKANAAFIALANPSKILELLAENEALREALEPFGELWMAARSSHKDEPDNLGFYGFNGTNITVGDLRRARALTEKQSALEGEE